MFENDPNPSTRPATSPESRLNVISSCARSPYFHCFHNDAAVYGEYAGRLSPYSLGNDLNEEYWWLRRSVALFDVPERPVEITGPDVVAFLNRVFTRRIDSLQIGRGRYGLLCNQRGGMVCDGIVFRIAGDRYWYVHADADVYTWLVAHADGFEVKIRDPQSWVLQIQGPRALDVLAKACDDGAPEPFRYFHIAETRLAGQSVLVSRAGWTGEVGFEVYNLDASFDASALWNRLLEAGREWNMTVCGLQSMNIRRIEAGILNYRTDMDQHTTPYDMGLGAFVDLDNHGFVDRDALADADKRARFTGFKSRAGRVRYGTAVRLDGRSVGSVTTYEISPYLATGVGFVLLDDAGLMEQTGLVVTDREGNELPLALVKLPFYDPEKRIPREA